MICKRKLLNLLLLATCILLLATVVFAETVEYVYDYAGKLIRAQYRDGETVTKVIDYYYDEVGNRVGKVVGLPDISIDPQSYDFGIVVVGLSSAPATFTVTNDGTVDLVIEQILDVGEFSVQSDLCSGQTVAHSGGTCTFDVVFSPFSDRFRSGNIMVLSDDPNTPTATVSLSGYGYRMYQLDVVKDGTGTGTVTSTAPGIDCGADCSELYDYDDVVVLTAVPDADTRAVVWSDCDNDQGGGVCEMTMDADKTVTATFDLKPTYTITATSGVGGMISPAGAVPVLEGEDQMFTIVPDTGFYVSELIIDGASQAPQDSYTFTNVTADHTIDVVFAGYVTLSDILESNEEDSDFGWSVSDAGDVNGDGFDDIVVGAPMYNSVPGSTEWHGAFFVFHGSATGINTTPAMMLEGTEKIQLGYSVSGAGDVNGDGYDDIIVSAIRYPYFSLSRGAAFIYHGSATGIGTTYDTIVECDQDIALFGISVSGAGDVNGDGYDDVIVGSENYENDQNSESEGAAFVYHGGPSGIDTAYAAMVESNQPYAYMGSSVSGAGDVNGDGYDDVIVGASDYYFMQPEGGAAFIYHGSASGISTSPSAIVGIDQATAYLGKSVSGAGDINGDGYDDVIVGAPNFDNGQINEGAVFIYLGSASGISMPADAVLELNQNDAYMGSGVSGAGDINNDGYDDVIVGAQGYSNPDYGEGAAFVYLGNAAGISSVPAAIMESDQSSAKMGRSVSGAGDVNGDGYDDVIAGAQDYDNGETDEGAAFIYHGHCMMPGYSIVATSNAGGTISPSGSIDVCEGLDQSFTITPDADYYIMELIIDGVSSPPLGSYTFENVTADHTIEAVFSNEYTLSVSKSGTGSGTVTSGDTLINCGSDCTEVYEAGQSVTLIAQPDPGIDFAGWSGGGCSGTGDCVVTVDADTTVTATFNVQPPVADFTGTPLTGAAPYQVDFTDTTSGVVDSWQWDFGDGSTSTEQNPSHVYESAGTYTVSLTVTNASGSDTTTKTDYITVTTCLDLPVRLVKLDSSTVDYATLQEAYNASADGEAIKSMAISISGSIVFDVNKTITIEGGYDCGFGAVIGDTTIIGNVDVINGYVDMGNFVIQ